MFLPVVLLIPFIQIQFGAPPAQVPMPFPLQLPVPMPFPLQLPVPMPFPLQLPVPIPVEPQWVPGGESTKMEKMIARMMLQLPPETKEVIDNKMMTALWNVCVEDRIFGESEHWTIRGLSKQDALDHMKFTIVEIGDAPPEWEAYRLPHPNFCNEMISLNRQIRRDIEGRKSLELDRTAIFDRALEDIDECYRIWEYMRDARISYRMSYRRIALRKYRDAMGEDGYRMAETPPVVPKWVISD